MKIKIITIFILTISLALFGNFDFFPENPANNADRVYSQIHLPLSYDINVSNSLLRLDDMLMFQEGHQLTDNEKSVLTADDFLMDFNTSTSFLNFGHKYWNFEFGLKTYGNVEILDKMYSNLVIYGNDTNRPYISNSGEGSMVFSFWRATLNYAYPKGLRFGMIPGLFPEKESNSFVEYLRDMTLYLGANINLDYSMMYASLEESSQRFGSMTDSLYYHYQAHFKYTDEGSVGRLTPSVGFGVKAKIFNGNFHAQIDDIFMQLNYKNLAGGWYDQYYRNDLFFFDEDYEAIEETFVEDDSTRVKNRYVKFKPGISVGMDYTIVSSLQVMGKYINNQHSYKNGFSLGLGYQLGFWPLQTVVGYDDNIYYEFKTGLIFDRFEWQTGATFYHGFFRYGKGIGLNSSMMFKF
ncbi:MAG: hypothetical protein U9P73_04795 [Candidatus Cloacimonadota bacterium]|nr:hypothetical protein [Candidatus Cloacimonadota bacterium]